MSADLEKWKRGRASTTWISSPAARGLLQAAEVLLDCRCDCFWNSNPVTRAGEVHRSIATEAAEVQLVERDAAHRRELLALQRTYSCASALARSCSASRSRMALRSPT